MSFKSGDKVLVNGGTVATIKIYDTDANVLVYEAPLHGGAVDTVTAHISNTRLEPLGQQLVADLHKDAPAKSKRSGVTNTDEPKAQILDEPAAEEAASDDE